MNKFVIWICLVFTTGILQAEDSILLQENFDNNEHGWYEANTKTTLCKVDQSHYYIENKTGRSNWIYEVVKDLNPMEEDFSVEMKLRQVGGNSGLGFGMLFSLGKKNRSYKKFLITSTGLFKVDHFFAGKSHVLVNYQKQAALNAGSGYNTLKITKKANLVAYYINDELVFKTAKNGAYGNRFAFFLGGKMAVEIDEVKVVKTTSSINLVANAHQIGDRARLGLNINSDYNELAPIISADGKELFVCRSGHPGNIEGNDIWQASLEADGQWTALKNIGQPLNNEGHNFVVSVAPDNNSMVVANGYQADGSPGGNGLSITRKTATGWTVPEKLKIQNFYNKDRFVAYFLCPDNKTLLMSVKRDDSQGEKDLYVSFLQDDGWWSEPKNMGGVLNTFENEVNPFIAADNKTLYFASQGHGGYGYHDIFVSKRLDDTWTNWTVPENLGPKINTVHHDFSFYLDAVGDYAYLSSAGDIWKIENPEKPEPIVLIKGKVFNQKTNKPLAVTIKYQDLETGEELGMATSNPVTGAYQIALPAGKKYSYHAEKEGFYAISNFIDLVELEDYGEQTVDLYLKPIEQGEVVRLNNIFFEFGKAVLKNESFVELNRLYEFLGKNKDLTIEISGHTDDKGSSSFNVQLSQTRAKAVVDYLIQKGIDTKRLKAIGYGEQKPLMPNDSEANRTLNRRVEFRIL